MEEQGQIAPLRWSRRGRGWDDSSGSGERCGFCAICLEKIALPEMALLKGCEHAYCVMCILRWATYRERPSCPQCKHPFEFLSVHSSLDGSIQDYMLVCTCSIQDYMQHPIP
ncbi:hypothetical protein C4D60_Mb05t09580 [Musa balbisiana]|uniref:RING-type domain-containing protein n=1 Tax=Musa balbisiana TaxID=52838 RepID=A0A4S8JUV9_MUSBA|nr:hypothetical protein C4D60_Mb05t09580 [Musa balbisiana]